MFTQRYPLELDGRQSLLQLSWKLLWRDFTVRLDGQVVGTGGLRALKAGRDFELPDSSVLRIQLDHGLLAVSRNSVPLPGSPLATPPPPKAASPRKPVRTLVLVALLIASFPFLAVVFYWAITGFFKSWPITLRCGLAFAIFAAFMASSFFATLRTRPRTLRQWLSAMGSYIDRLLKMAGNDPHRGT